MNDIWIFAERSALALVLGAIIGIERQRHSHPAGLRTNTLVALGSAFFVTLPYLIGGDSSPTRVAGQVVTGIGFLGAGVILREGLNMRGLNTAAYSGHFVVQFSHWCTFGFRLTGGSMHRNRRDYLRQYRPTTRRKINGTTKPSCGTGCLLLH